MEKSNRQRLKKAGWSAGSTHEFLELTDEGPALIEMELAMAESLRQRREEQNLTQSALNRSKTRPA